MAAERAPMKPGQLPPGRHGFTQQEVMASQRGRLLDGVVRSTAERGYLGMRVTDILGYAGVSRKTFYEHFSDKEECFLAAYDHHMADLLSVTAEAFEGPDLKSWPARISAGLVALLERLAENPDVARMCFVEVIGAGDKALAKREAALRNFTYFIDAGRGEASGDVPGVTALALLGGISELIASEVLHGSPSRLDQLAPDVVYLVCLPFLSPARVRKERERVREASRAST